MPLESSLHRVHLIPRPLQQDPIRQNIQKRLARWYGVQRRVRNFVDVPPEVAIRLKRRGVRNVPPESSLHHVYLVTAAPEESTVGRREMRAWRARQRSSRWYAAEARVRDHVDGILAVATVFQHGRDDHVPLESSLHRVHLVPRPLQQIPIRQHIQKRLARRYGVQ